MWREGLFTKNLAVPELTVLTAALSLCGCGSRTDTPPAADNTVRTAQ